MAGLPPALNSRVHIETAGRREALCEYSVLPVTQHNERNPFDQNFPEFRSKTEWIGSVQFEKLPKSPASFRGGPLFSVGPVRPFPLT